MKDEAYRSWIRTLPPIIPAEHWMGPVEACHVVTWAVSEADHDNLVPMTLYHHRLQHQMGIESFQKRFRVNLRAHARRLQQYYDKNVRAWPQKPF